MGTANCCSKDIAEGAFLPPEQMMIHISPQCIKEHYGHGSGSAELKTIE